MTTFEAWRTATTESRRYTGTTAAIAVQEAHKDFGQGTLKEFVAIVASYGFSPFTTGKQWVLIVPTAPLSPQMTNEPIPPDGCKG